MPAANYLCFVISPIGEHGSQKRQDYDDLFDLVIKPALEVFPFDVVRGDHTQEPNQINQDVIKAVQNASLCIADISEQNVNVYYEIGRRQQTEKPLLFVKRKNSDDIAVDLGIPRYIEYDLDSRHGIRDAIKNLRSAIVPFIDQGMDIQGTGATLTDIARKLTSLEQKINQMIGGAHAPTNTIFAQSSVEGDPFKGAKPHEIFAVAARERNVQLMDSVLDQLRYNTDEVSYLDRYASVAASMGSDKGGAQLLERALWFTKESSISFRMKIEYLGCLVSYLNRKDLESEHKELIEQMCETLKPISVGQPNKDVAQIYNQLNRLYHGIYSQNDDPKWLRLAIENLEIAKQYVPQESYVYFNLATCYRNMEDYPAAKENILSAIDLDRDDPDEDHLFLACHILSDMGEQGTDEYKAVFEQLNAISPVKARLIGLMK